MKSITINHRYTFRPIPILMVVIIAAGSFIQSPIILAEIIQPLPANLYSIYLSGFPMALFNCEAPVRIMPLGDSITLGSQSTNRNGYRKPLYVALTSASFWVDFVGNQNAGDTDFDRNHEGRSGIHAEDQTGITKDIRDLVFQLLTKNPADIVLLHIGTNDISAGGQDVNEVSRILDEIYRYDSGIIVILAKIINRKTYSPETTQYNQDLEVMANQRIANGDPIIVVDMENALTYPGDIKDDVHPNDQGYGKMASVWHSTLQNILPTCSIPSPGTPTPTATSTSAPTTPTYTPTGNLPDPTTTFTPEPANSPQPAGCAGLIQEAENGLLSGGFITGSDINASGSAFIQVPDGYGNLYEVNGNTNRANYCFQVNTPGVYRIIGWVYAPSLSNNSFYVQVNGSPEAGYLWDIPKNNGFQPAYVNNTSKSGPVEVSLAAGDHNLTVYLREDGTKLDKLELEYLGISTATPTAAPTTTPLATSTPVSSPPVNTDWEIAAPASVGMDESLLLQARDYALTGGGSGYILRNGKLVLAWGNPLQKYQIYSTTKSIGILALGLALKDNRLNLDDLAQQYHPSLGVPPDGNLATGWLDDITIRQLANHTAGFDKSGGYEALIYQPGSTWAYSDSGANWLAETLTLTFGEDLNELMFRRVFTPIGINNTDLNWRRNAYRSETINGITNREFASGISANVEALSRIGYLYLQEGQWNGQQLVPKEFVEIARTRDPGVVGLPVHKPPTYFNASDHYGLFFWNNADGTLANVPLDAFWSWGLGDSLIIVIPSLDIVAVRAGSGWRAGWTADYSVLAPFIGPIAQSVSGQ